MESSYPIFYPSIHHECIRYSFSIPHTQLKLNSIQWIDAKTRTSSRFLKWNLHYFIFNAAQIFEKITKKLTSMKF